MTNNLHTSSTDIKGTTVANGTAAPVAKEKITAAQIREQCPPQLTEYGKRIDAHLKKAEQYADKAEQHKASAGHYLGLVLDAVDEAGFDAFRDRFLPRSRPLPRLRTEIHRSRQENARANPRQNARARCQAPR
jgi:hypothetical protein